MVEFRVLGPVGAWSQGRQLPVSGSLRTALLAVLLLRANAVVTADSLIDTLWESAPPRTAPGSLQVMVHRLRQAFGAEHERLSTHGAGYRLRVDDGELDLHAFQAFAASGRSALAAGSARHAATVLRAALDLWSLPALGGTSAVRVLRDEADRLHDLRLGALEDRIAADLAAGAAADLVDELTEAVAANPTRERLRGQLMLALHRAQRTADALAAYRAGRRTLVADLGVEPGAALQDLHARLLRQDPDLLTGPDRAYPGRPAAARPRLVPHDVPHFRGRDRELAALAALPARAGAEGWSPTVVLAGMPGVGKTALALRFAHRDAALWPDGQLYVDLHGFDPERPPTSAPDALYQLLTALGVPAATVPAGLADRAALYRGTLHGRRVAVILDSAADVAQVRPLLPGTAGCMVIVTSRNRLTGLAVHDGAEIHTIEPLPADDSLAVLAGVLGPDRLGGEPEAARRLVTLSAGVPLALRISAANLLAHPGGSIAAHVALLAASPMDALRVDGDDRSVARVAFNASYRGLPEADRSLFRRLGHSPCADLAVPAAAVLGGCDAAAAEAALDRLATAHLVERYRPGRWRLHDLLRSYAAERASADEPPDRLAGAASALLAYYRTATGEAVDRLMSSRSAPAVHVPDVAAAVAWFDDERHNIVAAVAYAARHDLAEPAWRLAAVFTRLSLLRNHLHDAIEAGTAALGAATRAGDRTGLAHLRLGLGNAHYTVGDNEAAAGHYAEAIALADEIGWPAGQAAAYANLGVIHAATGRPLTALEHFRTAVELRRELGDPYGEAVARDNIGAMSLLLGDPADAVEHHRRALALHRTAGFQPGAALALANIGNALRELGDLDPARDACTEALTLYRATGSRGGEAQALCCLADVHADAGRPDEAAEAAEAALAAAGECGDERAAAEATNILGALALAAGDPAAATARHETALRVATRINYPVEIHGALVGLAAAARVAGDPEHALALVRRALALARAGHDAIAVPPILIELARVHHDRGARSAALARLGAAARLADRSGQRPHADRARALRAGMR